MTADDEPLRLRPAAPPPEDGDPPAGPPPPAGPVRAARPQADHRSRVVAPPPDARAGNRPDAGRPDAERVRALAADIGQPGVPVSLRAPADRPGAGVGTGHWGRHARRLSDAVERCRIAVAGVPAGAVRAELDRLVHIVELRSERYLRIVEVGQAVAPDDDTTDDDGTAPGERPVLTGAAAEIEQRLVVAAAHLAGVAAAVEQIALATTGATGTEGLPERLAALFAAMPDA